MHKSGKGNINDTYAVQESFLPTDRTFLRTAALGYSFSDARSVLGHGCATPFHFSQHTKSCFGIAPSGELYVGFQQCASTARVTSWKLVNKPRSSANEKG
jgi:hypothetical protein